MSVGAGVAVGAWVLVNVGERDGLTIGICVGRLVGVMVGIGSTWQALSKKPNSMMSVTGNH